MRGPNIYPQTQNVLVNFLPTFSLQTKCVCSSLGGKTGTDQLEDAKPIQEAPIHDYSPNHSTVGKRQNQHAGRTFRLTHYSRHVRFHHSKVNGLTT